MATAEGGQMVENLCRPGKKPTLLSLPILRKKKLFLKLSWIIECLCLLGPFFFFNSVILCVCVCVCVCTCFYDIEEKSGRVYTRLLILVIFGRWNWRGGLEKVFIFLKYIFL